MYLYVKLHFRSSNISAATVFDIRKVLLITFEIALIIFPLEAEMH